MSVWTNVATTSPTLPVASGSEAPSPWTTGRLRRLAICSWSIETSMPSTSRPPAWSAWKWSPVPQPMSTTTSPASTKSAARAARTLAKGCAKPLANSSYHVATRRSAPPAWCPSSLTAERTASPKCRSVTRQTRRTERRPERRLRIAGGRTERHLGCSRPRPRRVPPLWQTRHLARSPEPSIWSARPPATKGDAGTPVDGAGVAHAPRVVCDPMDRCQVCPTSHSFGSM